ncbi:hypothetical protein I8751_26670 [Nostocaceae cyanobacterium CENA357]|uniref:Uncharacterized protein n=1 Tax=Atlanticothrix silvestris CENA357 TaxID=1725252 RepID=A0A8J7L5B1_9CYAN|nr:hypothetical protein [Atlanticothrix silvestris]MBH8555864.1 hypothetical protein [Atlanticothrix silvestris CENA357]
MINKKNKKIKFNGMSYREIQYTNSKNRIKLHREEQSWLKEKRYKNIGWQNVINLYQKIEEILNRYQFEDLTLEELFLEADRIGNKYFTTQEIANFNQKLAIEVNEIAEEIDRQFPDTEIEFIDFSKNSKNRYNRKIYK